VNIHPGKVSAGCIVISGYWNSKNWKDVAYWRRPENDQKVFPLNIVPGIDIERWLQRDTLERENWRPSITFGTINFWAHILQIKLWAIIQKPELIDGYWGPATQRGLDEFCDRKGIAKTARMTPEIWAQLEG
jgi:hypothetical protein